MPQAAKVRGEFWPQDNWGRIANAAFPRDKAARIAIEAAEEAADIALERFEDKLHSVYLSGPAARRRRGGAAFYVLLRHGAPANEKELKVREHWEALAAAQLRRRYPRLGRITVSVFDWKAVFTPDGGFSPARFALAVNSICIAGRNMSRMLSPQRLDAAVANRDILELRPRLLRATNRISTARTPERVKAGAQDAAIAIISAAYALVLEREQVYTEDLDLRRELFAINYPTRRDDLELAYIMATKPMSEPLRALQIIDAAARWLTPMTDAWLNANNPQRAEHLRA